MENYFEKQQIKTGLADNLRLAFGRTLANATKQQLYQALAATVRSAVMDRWQASTDEVFTSKSKTLFYLSMEFLTGRFLGQELTALGKYSLYDEALAELGFSLSELEACEREPGLGNGGLGRLAACYLDSLACESLPAFGCGIRYDLGLFRQRIVDGEQVELPDDWLASGCAWEIARPEESVEILYGGHVREYTDDTGWLCHELVGANRVIAVPYDIPYCGYKNNFCDTLRIWSAKSPESIDMRSFDEGDYVRASAERELAATISRVLYPNDSHNAGKSLRLRQQYFFTSATLQFILSRHKQQGLDVRVLPDYVAIQINDTHPSIAIAELMRLLVDRERIGWDEAWSICTRVFSYTNHTIMSEALETWPTYLIENLLPRIWSVLCEIDRRCRASTGDRCSVIRYDSVHMADLCMCCCGKVNGVSSLHTDILRKSLFADYAALKPAQIISITNGVSPRRWLVQSNPPLASLITEVLGTEGWITDLSRLSGLEQYAEDSSFLDRLSEVKATAKRRFAKFMLDTAGVKIDPDSVFDVQVKRLHEYKRQLLNVLHILSLYFDIVENGSAQVAPHTFIFGAKASPGYTRAKQIISLIDAVSKLVASNPLTAELIKVVFVENYGVGSAGLVIPAADISEQLSLAGKEASGTGNMKFMMNGALTIGTLDGANVEMHGLLGDDNIFIFGMKADEVAAAYKYGRVSPEELCSRNCRLQRVVDSLADGTLPSSVASLKRYLLSDDPYFCIQDFADYALVHEKISRVCSDRPAQMKMAAVNIARSGFFSSDRSVAEYNDKIWKLHEIV